MPTVLVIEDDSSVRTVLEEMIGSGNYEVLSADNGEEGLELARSELPDIILCDISMPVLDGYGVLEKVRQDPELRMVPFIFLTGTDGRRKFRKGMELGADDFIPKPFTKVELFSAIQTQLRKREERLEQISEELEAKDRELNRLLRQDDLTGLPNQLAFGEQFTEQASGDSASGNALAIFSISLDRFSEINDSLGHEAADQVLQRIANRLQSGTGEEDTVARTRAAEFAVLLTAVENEEGARTVADQLLEQMKSPIEVQGHTIHITGSMGIALYPRHGKEINQLLECAGLARSLVKARNGNGYQVYSETLEATPSQQIEMETALRSALQKNEFTLNYQPIVRSGDGKISGAEVLIRWQNERMGFVPPSRFIPVAEESGMISDITWWVLETATRQMREWKTRGANGFTLSVNLSGQQFGESDLVTKIDELLNTADLKSDDIKLEITETAIIRDEEQARNVMKTFRANGIRVAVDDFGTGYSSFSYLQQFPVDILKIDQTFIRNLPDDHRNMEITRAIIQMAHNLELSVIAEGVETNSERNFLRDTDCDELQGFLFSKPLPADEFEEYLFGEDGEEGPD